jgi:hypothetical protein
MPSTYRLSPPGNPFAFWSLIMGVAGFCIPFAGGLAAVVLGVMGMQRAKAVLDGRGVAVTGLVLGIVSIVCHATLFAFGWGLAALFSGHAAIVGHG